LKYCHIDLDTEGAQKGSIESNMLEPINNYSYKHTDDFPYK